MTNSETKNFSQNVSSSYHLEDRGKCNKNTCANARNVPKLRFKGYNDEWVEHKLDEKGIFLKGSPISKNDISQYGKPCILYGELYTKYDEVATKIFSVTDTQDKNLVTSKINDVLIPSSGETAIDISTATCILNDDVILGGDLNIYRTKDCDGRFISYSINHKNRRKIAKLAQGATIFHLYPNFLKKFKILLPSLHEQEKIASFLTLIDKKIEKQKELVELLKKYKRGLLSAIFSQKLRFKDDNGNDYPAWEEKRLGDICKTFSGGTPSVANSEYYNGEIPFIKSGEIHSDRTEMFITVEGLENSSAKLVNKGDLLYALYGATSGEVDISKIDGAINQAILCVKSDTLNLNYLKELLAYNKNRILCKYLQGGQGNLSADIFKALKFYFSIKEEQNKISDLLISYDKTIKIEEHLLNYYVSYKQGLLQQLFI